jgi:hypothetical protein
MKLSRLLIALFVPWSAASAAAAGGPAPDQPFAEVRKDLNDMKAPASPLPPRSGLDFGAAGIDAGTRFSAPPPALPEPAKTDPGVASQRPASSGWLLDALEENSRRTGVGLSSPTTIPVDDEATDQRRADSRPGSTAAGNRDSGSLDRGPASKSPLSAYLSAWLSPEEFRRLQSLYPDLAEPTGTKDLSSGNPGAGRSPPSPEAGDPWSRPGNFGELNLSPNNANPYLAGLPGASRPPAVTVIPLDQPKLTPPVAVIRAVPEPAPVRMTPPVVPPAPGADDRKYFPQLKRF